MSVSSQVSVAILYSKNPSLHRSQISGDLRPMQAKAAEFAGCAGRFCCILGEKTFKRFVSILLLLKQALKIGAPRLFKCSLARYELVAAAIR